MGSSPQSGAGVLDVAGLADVEHHEGSGLCEACPDRIEHRVGRMSSVRGHRGDAHGPGAGRQGPVELGDGEVDVDQAEEGSGEEPALVVEGPRLVEPAVERLEVRDDEVTVVAELAPHETRSGGVEELGGEPELVEHRQSGRGVVVGHLHGDERTVGVPSGAEHLLQAAGPRRQVVQEVDGGAVGGAAADQDAIAGVTSVSGDREVSLRRFDVLLEAVGRLVVVGVSVDEQHRDPPEIVRLHTISSSVRRAVPVRDAV